MFYERILEIQKEVEPRSQRAFELGIGKTNGYLNMMKKRGSIPSADVILSIIDKYPNFSLEWLMTGKGDKYSKPEIKGVNEEGAVYNAGISELDFIGLSKRIDFVIKQNSEILDKLNRSVVKEVLESEMKRVRSSTETLKEK